MQSKWRPLRRLPAVLIALLIAGASSGTTARVEAQPAPPGDAVAAAVAALEPGYVARFAWSGGRTTFGEVRYLSPVAYSLLLEDERGAGLEYVMLDPVLYNRTRAAGDDAWEPWLQREWHADAPVNEVMEYHPRLPLELLRAARDLRDTDPSDASPLRRIDGSVNFLAALTASYDEALAPPFAATAEGSVWPLAIWLGPSDGRVVRLQLTVPASPEQADRASVLEYTFQTGEPLLTTPSEAREVESALRVRPAPEAAPESLPLTVRGSGSLAVSPPFVTASGSFMATLNPGFTSLQYELWRTKRGRQLVAGFGAIVGLGTGRLSTVPLVLNPGEYVLEVELPEDVEWTLTIEEMASAPVVPTQSILPGLVTGDTLWNREGGR